MFEFVAEGGGAFKFEFLGGFEHLFFELENGFVDAVFNAFFGDDLFDGFIGGGIDGFEAFLNLFLNGFGGDVVFAVVGELFFASGIALGEHALHGIGYVVGVEDDASVDVAGGASGGLNEGAFGAEEALFICVKNGDEGDFWEVEAFAEEVDADEAVDFAVA